MPGGERGNGIDPQPSLAVRIGQELGLAGSILGGLVAIGNSLGHRPAETIVSSALMVGSGMVRSYLQEKQQSKKR